jgi:hypothetical protein
LAAEPEKIINNNNLSRIVRTLCMGCPIIPMCKDRIILPLDIEWNKKAFFTVFLFIEPIFFRNTGVICRVKIVTQIRNYEI